MQGTTVPCDNAAYYTEMLQLYNLLYFTFPKVLLSALDSAVDVEEQKSIVTYIAFAANPQPQMISELENRIGNDTHSTDPLLLAYGALVAKASPDLQQRMTLFLLSQLPQAETNSSSLIHHILSLGNTESHQVTSSLTDYVQHPDHHVQLSSIYALRYATSDSLVQKALTTLLSQSQVSDEHLATVLRCLLYGIEHASNTHTQTPFNIDLATALTSSVMNTVNEDLHHTLVHYLQVINTAESKNLLKSMTAPHKDGYSNSTRSRRGTNWDESNSVYNLVASQSSRRADESRYPYHKAYIWGKQFGVSKANVQIAAGGFIGVSLLGDYKVFGRAKAVGHAFGKTKTAVDVLVLREKTSTSVSTKLYVEIVGKILVNVNDNSNSQHEDTNRPVSGRKYTLFDFGIPIFVYVTTIRVYLAGYIRLSDELDLEFSQESNSVTAAAGLFTTLTMELEAGASTSLLVSLL